MAGLAVLLSLPVNTPRLTIRRATVDDTPAVQEVFGDPDVWTYMGGIDHKRFIKSPESASAWVMEQAKDEEEKGFCIYALEEKTTGEVVGFAGFLRYLFGPDIQLEIAIGRKWWQSGYGTEAGEALLSLGCRVPEAVKIYALLWGDNEGAVKLVQRLGMSRRGRKPAADGWPEYEVYDYDCPPWTQEEHEERRLARLFRTPQGRRAPQQLLP